MSRKYLDYFLKRHTLPVLKILLIVTLNIPSFNVHVFRYHLQTHEIEFYKLILIRSSRCSLSNCYLVLAYNFDNLKTCLQKKRLRALIEVLRQ